MKEDLFSVPLRRYHIDNNADFSDFANQLWKENRFSMPSPFLSPIPRVDPTLGQVYSDVIEEFLSDIGCYDTHACGINGMILKILEKGESTDRCDTLPSHYTLIHYIEVDEGSASDTFHHPARALINAFRPSDVPDEWKEACGLYINAGDVIIYPSYIEHSSPVYGGSKKRVTMTLPLILEAVDEQGRESNTEEPTSE